MIVHATRAYTCRVTRGHDSHVCTSSQCGPLVASQEKYVRRKAAKYIVRFRLLKSCARYLCEALFIRQPRQIWWVHHRASPAQFCLHDIVPLLSTFIWSCVQCHSLTTVSLRETCCRCHVAPVIESVLTGCVFALAVLHLSFLRYDSLAQLLCFANVRAGMDIIVVESCAGFVTGCVAERMGGATLDCMHCLVWKWRFLCLSFLSFCVLLHGIS